MRIAVASGKGGTGKTMISVNLSTVAGLDMIDLDVEEPNAFLYFEDGASTKSGVNRPVPSINEEVCDLCGECVRICAFNALIRLPNKIKVDEELCHGCGACSRLCHLQAIKEIDHEVGDLITIDSGERRLNYGRLKIGEANSIPLIAAVKDSIPSDKTVIVDCPPGTSCNMVEAVKDSDYAIMVTEPTPFGAHDLVMAIEVLERLNIPHGVVINKDGSCGADVSAICASRGITVLGSIPFRKDIAEFHAAGELLINHQIYRQKFIDIWKTVMKEARI
ncbi:MAG: 4Fe-4S binding protein [Euryarchaeota archaeon]|nr:4Fe-4S binding protein [Euryarchaeota archaeon]